MSGKDGEKHVFSYMDGIPVKISEKYKPPRRVVLSVSFQNRFLQPPPSAEYDFGLERGVLDKLQQWRELRSSEREKRRERIALDDARLQQLQELQDTMQELSAKDVGPKNGAQVPTPPPPPQTPPAVTPAVAPTVTSGAPLWIVRSSMCTPPISEPDPILRPIPIKHQVAQSQVNNNKPICAFNISDFEADTSSPFDNMELKTINDLEELAQVLQPSMAATSTSYYQPNTESTRVMEQTYVNQYQNVNHNPVNYAEHQPYNATVTAKIHGGTKELLSTQTHLNGFTSPYGMYNSMQNNSHHLGAYPINPPVPSYQHPSVIPPVSSREQVVAYNFVDRDRASQMSTVPYSYPPQDSHRNMYRFYTNNAWPSSDGYRTAPSVHEAPAHGFSRDVLAASTSKAYKPEASPSPSEQAEQAPHTAGPTPGVDAIVQQLNDLMKSHNSVSQKKTAVPPVSEAMTSSESVSSNSNLPDPFTSLEPEHQHLVQKLAEMGFPRSRVARACQSLGGNDKKMIEYLLSLQSLLDAGHPEHRAEQALLLNDQDTETANRFLQAESQLLDLGFSRERVSEALVKFNCDRDKALDFLIS